MTNINKIIKLAESGDRRAMLHLSKLYIHKAKEEQLNENLKDENFEKLKIYLGKVINDNNEENMFNASDYYCRLSIRDKNMLINSNIEPNNFEIYWYDFANKYPSLAREIRHRSRRIQNNAISNLYGDDYEDNLVQDRF